MSYWDDIERARRPHEGPYTYVQTTPLPRITTMSKIDPKQCVMCGGVGEHSADCATPHWRYPERQTPRNLQLAMAEAGMPGWVLVPREPFEAMADAGAHCNSEWLNDNAPIGERRYRDPAIAVWRTMLRVALGEDPNHGMLQINLGKDDA